MGIADSDDPIALETIQIWVTNQKIKSDHVVRFKRIAQYVLDIKDYLFWRIFDHFADLRIKAKKEGNYYLVKLLDRTLNRIYKDRQTFFKDLLELGKLSPDGYTVLSTLESFNLQRYEGVEPFRPSSVPKFEL